MKKTFIPLIQRFKRWNLLIIYPFFISLYSSLSQVCFLVQKHPVTSVNRSKIHKLANKGDRKAKKLLKLIDNKNDLISSILVGNNIVNILASVLATAVLIEYFGSDGIFYSTLVMTCLIVIFAEVLPKNIALIKADRFALFFFNSINNFCKNILSINLVLKFLNHTTYKIFGIDHKNSTNSVTEDIRNMIDMPRRRGRLA